MPELFLKSILTREPFESYVLPVSEFPIPLSELGVVDAFLQKFCASVMKRGIYPLRSFCNSSSFSATELEKLLRTMVRHGFPRLVWEFG